MTHRGPFQPLLFCDSVILLTVKKKDQECLCSLGARFPLKLINYATKKQIL